MNLQDTYNQIADDWAKDHQSDTWWVGGTEHFVSLLPQRGTILDAGCGSGWKSKFLTDHGFQVTGFDFSEKLLAIARAQVPDATFLFGDLYDQSTISGQFDGVFAQASLLHIEKARVLDVIRQLTARVGNGGYLYIAVKERRAEQSEEEMLKEDDYGYAYARFFSFYTMPELLGYLTQVGLEPVYQSTEAFGRTNWLQIIAKNPTQ